MVTDSTGYALVTYYSPEPSDIIEVRAISTGARSGFANLGIRISEPLFELQEGTNIARIGVVDQQPRSHWGTLAMLGAIQQLADSLPVVAEFYRDNPDSLDAGQVFSARLEVNDLSLITGGVFDVDQNWRADHREHRYGRNADIRIRRAERRVYREAARQIWLQWLNRTTFHPHPPGLNEHVHLKF